MTKPYVVTVRTDEIGTILNANLVNNRVHSSIGLRMTDIPLFIYERVALLRLTDISKTATGELIGRKVNPEFFTIYIDKSEHKHMIKMLTGVNK
jgi:hypothetical protein